MFFFSMPSLFEWRPGKLCFALLTPTTITTGTGVNSRGAMGSVLFWNMLNIMKETTGPEIGLSADWSRWVD
jgi:hypothetical protein